MNVDFNNLRKQIAYSLDNVIKTLNHNTFTDHSIEVNGHYINSEKAVVFEPDDIQKDIDELRQNVGILLCCYEPDNPSYKDVSEEVTQNGGIAWFNEDDN